MISNSIISMKYNDDNNIQVNDISSSSSSSSSSSTTITTSTTSTITTSTTISTSFQLSSLSSIQSPSSFYLLSYDIIIYHDISYDIVVYHRHPNSSTRSKGCSSPSTWQTRFPWVRCWSSWQAFQWTSTSVLNQSFVPSGTRTAATLGSAGHLATAMAFPVRLPTTSPSNPGTNGVSSNSWER